MALMSPISPRNLAIFLDFTTRVWQVWCRGTVRSPWMLIIGLDLKTQVNQFKTVSTNLSRDCKNRPLDYQKRKRKTMVKINQINEYLFI